MLESITTEVLAAILIAIGVLAALALYVTVKRLKASYQFLLEESRRSQSDRLQANLAAIENAFIEQISTLQTAMGESSSAVDERLQGLKLELSDSASALTARIDAKAAEQLAKANELENSFQAKLDQFLTSSAANMETLSHRLDSADDSQRRLKYLMNEAVLQGRHLASQVKQLTIEGGQHPSANEQKKKSSSRASKPATIRDRILDSGEPVVVLVAGMRHSGSTAIYNLVRFVLEDNGVEFKSGYSELGSYSESGLLSEKPRILKTHELRDDIAEVADFVITTRRDLRDSVASAKRRGFKMYDQIGGAAHYAKYNRSLYEIWADRSDLEVVYETFVADQETAVKQVCNSLGFKDADISALCERVGNIPQDKYEETLLSDTHITDPDQKLSYTDTLSEEEIGDIEKQNFAWLDSHSYKVLGHR